MDPKRCMKCQGIGVNHMAAACKSIHDVCARCAGMHRTDQCGVGSSAEFKCANCHEKGHGAADRECPIFKAKLAELHAKIPNYAYRFFPTKDPNTWERTETGHDTANEAGRGQHNYEKGAATAERKGRQREEGAGYKQSQNQRRDNGWPRRQEGGERLRERGSGSRGRGRSQARQTRMEEMWAQLTGTQDGDGGGSEEQWGDRVTGDDVGPAKFGAQSSHRGRNA
jgi:hypothetical protein